MSLSSNVNNSNAASRREFLQTSGQVAAGAAIAASALSTARTAYAAGDDTIRLALIGCGGRGGGAVLNALTAPGGPVKLHAMADIFADRLNGSHDALAKRFGDQVDVPPERRFVGFDAYRHAIDTLRPGDIAMLTTNAYCRPMHYEYAVEKGVNIFMEKSFAPDPAGLNRMLAANEMALKKNLKIASGLMCRHSPSRQVFIDKVRNGELGDLPLVRAYRMGGGHALAKRPADRDELEWQIRHKTSFFWASSGIYIEWLIHQFDECCWLMDAWPTQAEGLGGRVPDSTDAGQDLDTYTAELTFPNEARAMVFGRFIRGCKNDFATYVHGTKKSGQFSGQVHAATVHTFKGRSMARAEIDWQADKEPCSPWQAEWNVLIEKIRKDQPHNETKRAVYANFAAIMGRAAVHSGKVVTWDEITNSNFAFCDYVDSLDYGSPAPVHDKNGKYPAPRPGEWVEV